MKNTVDVKPVSISTVGLHGYVLPVASKISTRALMAIDRCDYCSAAARVRAVKNTQELLFCGNHGRKNVVGLVENGWLIDDQGINT